MKTEEHYVYLVGNLPYLLTSYTVTGKRKMFCGSKPSVKGGEPQEQSAVKISCDYTVSSET